MTDAVTYTVEYSCRHRDVVSRPLYVDWIGTHEFCEVCQEPRKIIWVEGDE